MLHYFLLILKHCVGTDIHVVNVSVSYLQVVDSFKTCDNLIIVMQQLPSVHLGLLYTHCMTFLKLVNACNHMHCCAHMPVV